MTQGGHRVANRIRFGKDFNKYGESRGQSAPETPLAALGRATREVPPAPDRWPDTAVPGSIATVNV